MAESGMSMPAIRHSVSRRATVSLGVLAWTVVSEPSWPVFIAWSMSRASPPRHSPTTMRSGRMRRQFLTRRRIDTSPFPSALAGLASMRTTWLCWSFSSSESSTVMMRSSGPMQSEMALRSDVLPEPVPPETTMFFLKATHASMNFIISGLMEPNETSLSSVKRDLPNFRIVRHAPSGVMGGMTALTREPSSRRASTSGLDSSMRRPTLFTIRSMTRMRCPGSRKCRSESATLPLRST